AATPAGTYSLTVTGTSGSLIHTASVALVVQSLAGINVALASNGAVAVASSTYSSNYSPAGAINGDRKGLNWAAGGGWEYATAGSFPDWLEVDFNGLKTIQQIVVVTVQDNYSAPIEPTASTTFTLYGLTSYQVQYWTGSQWLDVPGGVISGNNLVLRQFNFS